MWGRTESVRQEFKRSAPSSRGGSAQRRVGANAGSNIAATSGGALDDPEASPPTAPRRRSARRVEHADAAAGAAEGRELGPRSSRGHQRRVQAR